VTTAFALVFASFVGSIPINQGVTKRCRLSRRTISALVYEPNAEGGRGELRVYGSQPMITAVHRSPINLGDLTLYLTYAINQSSTVYVLLPNEYEILEKKAAAEW
jgi:hypothetical protein